MDADTWDTAVRGWFISTLFVLLFACVLASASVGAALIVFVVWVCGTAAVVQSLTDRHEFPSLLGLLGEEEPTKEGE